MAHGVAALAPEIGKEASVHFAYEMVALSVAACDQLAIELSAEDRARPFIEMSGRKAFPAILRLRDRSYAKPIE